MNTHLKPNLYDLQTTILWHDHRLLTKESQGKPQRHLLARLRRLRAQHTKACKSLFLAHSH